MNDFFARLVLADINQIIAAFSFASGFIVLILGVLLRKKEVLKLAGLLLVIAIAFYSNNATVHVISVFIIATLITNLDFVVNLAAIFRGSAKEVFSFKLELLDRQDQEAKIVNEIRESEQEMPGPPKKIGEAVRDYIDLEAKALDFLAAEYGPIDRYVRFTHKDTVIEFDAMRSGDKVDKLFEVKLTSSKALLTQKVIPDLQDRHRRYVSLSGREAEACLVVVSDLMHPHGKELQKEFIARFRDFKCQYLFLDPAKL